MHFQGEHIWFVAALALPAWLTLRILRHPLSQAEMIYGWLLIAHCGWIVGQALELAATSLEAKLWLDGLQYYPMCFAGGLSILFAHRFTGGRAPRGLLLLYAFLTLPTATYYLLAPFHGLSRRDAYIIDSRPFQALNYAFEPGDAFLTLLLLAAGIYGIVVMLQHLRKIGRSQLESAAPILVGYSLPTIVGLLSLFIDHRVLGQRDISFVIFGIAGACVFWGVRNRRAVVTVPIARELVFDRIPQGAIVTDGDGVVLELNRAGAVLLGVRNERAGLGQNLKSFGTAQLSTASLWQLTSQDETVVPSSDRKKYFAAIRHPLKDVGAELFLVRDVTDQEEARRVLLTHRDILRERVKESSLQLEFTERKFRAIFEESFQLIGLLDTDGTLLQVNRAALSLIDKAAEDVIGKPFWDTPWWTHSERLRRRLMDAFQLASEGHFQRFEATHPGPNGSTRLVDFSLKPVRDGEGNVTMLIPEGRDITELRFTEQQLIQAQKMESLGRLAGGVAHDFNNLLTVISGNLGILEEACTSPEALQALKESQYAASSAAALTQQLLTFGRKSTATSQVLDVREQLNQTATMLRRLLGTQIAVEVDLQSTGHFVFADTQFKQLMLNLAVNAKDAMPDGGTLTIRSRRITKKVADHARDKDWLEIEVSDNGTGISPELLDRIFEPFFTTKEIGKGTGLGLAMVYGAMQQHEGAIEVKSSPGDGTRFFLYFKPAEASEAEVLSRRSRRFHAPHEDMLVYVVEDEPAVRRTIERMMRRSGFQMQTFSNPHELLDGFEARTPPQLLISDAIMPNMTGFELLELVREKWPEVPTILMSGHAAEERIREAARQGVVFLSKPFTVDSLLGAINDVLSRDSAAI